ncbi:alpha/beta fold hydrolase [Streptomyces sp. SAJ15]|uniref:alpha/beta fold hydrolase n=1 Tax=Streptomyces sp. SAJ15 TaxID=2011095 RepID=UPI00118640A4|nr:alpha/beta hydrolase [Streptomyces sp. SAJ15]TVL91194.1 alpha/beta hydrolase [Streptomyces sp. SAJ15]
MAHLCRRLLYADDLEQGEAFGGVAPDGRRVHGTGSAGAAVNWGQTLPRFTPHRTVITPDLSGTDATVDDGAPLTAERLAAQVIAVIEATEDGPVDLLGFSMGATVAATVAALRPDLVRRLILVAGWAHTGSDEYLTSLFTLWQNLGASDPASFGRAVAMTGFSRGFLNTIGRDQFEALIPNMPPTPGTLRHIHYDLRVDIRPLLPRIEAPTLVIGGSQDITVPVEHSWALHAAISGSGYAEIDAGHVMFFEQEDAFVKLVTDFTEGPSTTPAATDA